MKTSMLLIIFWGQTATLMPVSCDCDLGSLEVNSFDWNQVGIIVLARFL
jgi:hypothetical protein